MILYISGPMSGIPNDNFSAFFEAEEKLRAAGYVTVNPARGSAPVSDGRYGEDWWESDQYQAVLRRGIRQLEGAQGLAQLPGWPQSNGAKAEKQRAWMKGVPIGSVDDWVKWDLARAIRWTGDPECIPSQSYPGDAGFDLVVSLSTRIHVGAFVDVDLGIRVELPPGTWALLTGRSSTLRRRGILVTQGVIDQGYRGPLFAGCQNLSDQVVVLERGERVAQLIPMPLVAAKIGVKRVDALGPSERGEAAFGSSGGFVW